MDTIKSKTSKSFNATKDFVKSSNKKFHEGNIKVQIIGTIIICLLGIFIIYLVSKAFSRLTEYKDASPYLVQSIKNAQNAVILSQRPDDGNLNNLIRRSKNESGGIEFTYHLWLLVSNWNYRAGSWKHIFHKGNPDSWPNRAPGVWFHPNKNIIRVYMNSYEKLTEYIDIPNIPLKKWFHLTIVCKGHSFMTYINGNLRKKLILQGIPKQNYGDVYINQFGGFDGYVSKFRYHDYALSAAAIRELVREPPSNIPCTSSMLMDPPYLATNWWHFNY